MRVAFVNPQGNFDSNNSYLASHPDFGGQLVYVREVARALGEMGHHADILTRRIIDPEWPEFASPTDAYKENPNVRILRVPCGPERFLNKEELWPFLGEWAEGVARLYREEDDWPDTWTGHYADGGLGAALLEELSGAPFTFTGHSLGAWKLDSLLRASKDYDTLSEVDEDYSFGARIHAEQTAIARSSAIVTSSVTERYEQYAHPAYRDLADPEKDVRFVTIPPGVNLDIFSPEARSPWEDEVKSKIRSMHERDIDPDRRGLPAVIAWSRLDPKKNHLALVRAFAKSSGLRESANLVMITRGLEDPLREPASAPKGQREVLANIVSVVEAARLWGSVSAFSLSGQTTLAALYRWGADTGGVFCLPAEYEPFGMTLIEAMAVGLPVVATKNGGPRDTTDEGRAGLLADPHDLEDIATKLLRLVGDRETWHIYADRGRERVRERYTWQGTAEGYLRLAEKLSTGRSGGNRSFPLPSFARGHAELPRLRSWRTGQENDSI
ncbi:MAG: glycosyltransferase [Rubrobacteraceae bacterium]